MLCTADPRCELVGVWNGGGKKDERDMCWQHDDDLFPDHATLKVVDVMYLVKDDKLDISNEISSAVEHTPQNLGGHDQTAGFRVDLDVASQDTDFVKLQPEVPELLVAQRLDR